MPLMHLGISEDVRVCDGCHIKLVNKEFGDDRSRNSSAAVPPRRGASLDDLRKQEDEDLEKAIAASLENGTSKKKEKKSKKSRKSVSFKENTTDEEDADLKAAIEASLKESQNPSKVEESSVLPPYPLAYTPANIYEEPPKIAPEPERVSSQVSQVKAPSVTELSAREIENLKLFAELVEKTDADVALRGIQSLNVSQLQVSFAFMNIN